MPKPAAVEKTKMLEGLKQKMSEAWEGGKEQVWSNTIKTNTTNHPVQASNAWVFVKEKVVEGKKESENFEESSNDSHWRRKNVDGGIE